MARSSYIYVIHNPTLSSVDSVVAAFTVKHECQTFIKEARGRAKRDWVVMRYPDSPCIVEPGVMISFDT